MISPSGQGGLWQLTSLAQMPIVDAGVTVEVRQVAAQSAGVETFLLLEADSSNSVSMFVEQGVLGLQLNEGTATQNFVTYNPATHHYWRIRHLQGSTASIAFETSADGNTWTALLTAAVTPSFGVHDFTVSLGVLVWQVAVGDAGTAVFDNLNICP